MGINGKEVSCTDVGSQWGCKISVIRSEIVEKVVAAGNTNNMKA